MSGGYYGFTSGGTQYGSVAPYSYGTAGTNAATTYNPPVAYNYNYTAGATASAGAQLQPPGTNTARPAATNYSSYGTTVQYAAPSAAATTGSTAPSQQKSQAQSESATYTGYDAALYAAAKSYLASKSTGNSSQWMSMKKTAGSGGGGGGTTVSGTGSATTGQSTGGGYNKFGGGGVSGGRGSFPRRGGGQFGGGRNYGQNTQVHYCETCKISCGALQTYREHLEGKMHKKKEALAKSGPTNPARSKNSFYCEICEIMCTGSDTFQSHVRGSKHQKTLRLHQQMGKPLPSQEAKVIPPAKGPAANGQESKKMVVVQKTNFVAGEKLISTGVSQPKVSQPAAPTATATVKNPLANEEDVQPVGEDYLEVIKIENDRVTAYQCKLCDCRFTDLGAKDMHMKGRRHRLNYKKKVNPDLEVEVKMNPKIRRQWEDKARRDLMRMRQHDIYTLRALYQSHMTVPTAFGNMFSGGARAGRMAMKDTQADRYIMAKHNTIYPTSEECAAAQRLVVSVEKALKNISDMFSEEDMKVKKETQTLSDSQEERLLKGVMRVGDLAKQLLLKGDFRLELVVLCNERPTENLLCRIADLLPQKFDNVNADNYDVISSLADASLVVKMTKEPYFELKITFTSVAVREEASETTKQKEPLGVLDKQKCLEALASLRHAKWFQARCASVQFCLILLRVLKDFCQRTPAWIPLTSWATELMVEKILNSGSVPVQPIEAFRRFFEAIASGILMKNGPGLMDPCEKTPVDAVGNLSPQQREDITASAQYILRMIAFGKVHTVLGIEKAEVNGTGQRKRPREDVEMGEVSNGKKDKKET